MKICEVGHTPASARAQRCCCLASAAGSGGVAGSAAEAGSAFEGPLGRCADGAGRWGIEGPVTTSKSLWDMD